MGNHPNPKKKDQSDPPSTTTQEEQNEALRFRKRLMEDEKIKATVPAKNDHQLPPLPFDFKDKPPSCTRFVVLSDTHSKADQIKKVPLGDVLIHCGDFSDRGEPGEVEAFEAFLKKLPHKHKIVIAGNHELSFFEGRFDSVGQYLTTEKVENPERIKQDFINHKCCTYLEHSGITMNGIKIYGIPWINNQDKDHLESMYSKIPQDTNILISHCPPYGFGDLLEDKHIGHVGLLKYVNTVKPKYHLFGHVHEAYGVFTNGSTIFVNAATCTRDLQPEHTPIVFDVPNG